MSKYIGSSFGKHRIQIRWFCCHLWAMLHFEQWIQFQRIPDTWRFFVSDFFEPPKFPVMQFQTLVDIGLMLPFVYESGNLPKWSLRLKLKPFITNSLRLIDLILPGKYMVHNAWNHGWSKSFTNLLQVATLWEISHVYWKGCFGKLPPFRSFQIMSILGINVKFQGGVDIWFYLHRLLGRHWPHAWVAVRAAAGWPKIQGLWGISWTACHPIDAPVPIILEVGNGFRQDLFPCATGSLPHFHDFGRKG